MVNQVTSAPMSKRGDTLPCAITFFPFLINVSVMSLKYRNEQLNERWNCSWLTHSISWALATAWFDSFQMSHWLIIQVLTRIIMTNQLLCRYNLLKKVVVNNKKLRAIKTPCFRVLCTIWDFFGLIMNQSAEALLHGKFLTQVEKKNPFFFFSFSWRNLCFSLRSTDDSLWGFFLVFLAGCLYYSCSIVVATETSEKEPGG